jgi:hypothetical protein
MPIRSLLLAGALACAALPAVSEPRTATIKDADTRAWWTIAEHLSSDAMEGRDTGSPGYDRAADWVIGRFKAAGLRPAGTDGGWRQTFPVHEARVESDGSAFAVVAADASRTPLRFLHDITVRADDGLPAHLEAPLTFAADCRPQDLTAAAGKVAVCFNTRRTGRTTGAERVKNAKAAGAAGLIQVDDPYFTIEPPRWPAAYARDVAIADGAPDAGGGFPVMTLNAEALPRLIAGSGQDAAALLKAGGTGAPAPLFDIPARLSATLKVTTRDYTASNVLALMPGSDPKLGAEIVVLSAHLDGYGYGEPVDGDGLYNGALDDAAYVGTLIRFAERHQGKPLKRSVLLAVVAGEEKGLLGSRWFVAHPTVRRDALIADINLDQLRPLFPLKLMTVAVIGESTLGDTAREVAAAQGVRTQADPEPERNLVRRSDHYPFMQIGVPATGFVFGYEPGTEAEARYREWYRTRYHRPQDDVSQPMDFEAAGAFNRFFYTLAETVADAPQRPAWKPGSAYAPAR